MRTIGEDGMSVAWKTRFEELLHYKQTHGHCDVPTEWKGNPKLGSWVANQRQLKKQGNLRPERERLLNEIRFIWDKRRIPKEFTRDPRPS